MSDGPLATVGKSIGELLMQLLATIGLALGGGQAAASSDLGQLQQDAWNLDPARVLTPETLAELVVKGWVDVGDAAHEATYSGINASRFQAMVDGTGNPPGPETLLSMLRRSIIDRSGFERGVKQGYTRNEWIEPLAALEYDLPAVSQLVEGVVQNHVDPEAARLAAKANGLPEEWFTLYVDNAGNPPGPETTLTMMNRGIIDQAQATQALRESRLKDKYIPAFLQLARRRIPMRTVSTLIGHGVLSKPDAERYLQQLGFSGEDADLIIAAAPHTATSAAKEASLATIRSLYVDRIISRDEATADLEKIGYDARTADLLLQLADSQALQRIRNAAVTRIRGIFVSRRVDEANARSDLAKLGVAPDQVGYMIQLWTIERDANVKVLTPAQIVSAGKKGILDEQTVLDRLQADGYSADDARVLAMEGGAIAPPKAGA